MRAAGPAGNLAGVPPSGGSLRSGPAEAGTPTSDSEFSKTMARNYPGFLAAFFIILLRVAIGWHFLNEGIEKYESGQNGKEAFSAEIYLRNANGPLAPYFREIVPDVDSRDMLDLSKLKTVWRADAERVADGFGFSEDQRSQAGKKVDESERWADACFSSPDNAEKRGKYFHDLDVVEKTERKPDALSYELERAWESRRSLEADRRSLIAPLVEQGKTLHEAVANLATSEQVASADNALPRMAFRQVKSAGNWAIAEDGACRARGYVFDERSRQRPWTSHPRPGPSST